MTKTEIHYHADRGNGNEYQSLDVVQELGNNRQYIQFHLMETRWRSVDEAADYLRWAAAELEKLK
jgi:lysine/ornithine N-monooxygenase